MSPQASYARRVSTSPFTRRVFRYRDLRDALRELVRDLPFFRRRRRLPRHLRERIWLAVTEVNGCRYCSFLHSRSALASGLEEDEVRALLEGELRDAPADELDALMFGQHWADMGGHPDTQSVHALVAHYGRETAADIIMQIRGIMFSNLYGNTLDALLWRLRGRALPGPGLLELVATLIGSVWIAPAAVLAYAWRKVTTRDRPAPHPVDAALGA